MYIHHHQVLLRTARKTDPLSSGWAVNGAGRHVHHDYGYGLIDAHAATQLAAAYDSTRHRMPYVEARGDREVRFEISGGKSHQSVIRLQRNLYVEHVAVQLWLYTEYRYARNFFFLLTPCFLFLLIIL